MPRPNVVVVVLDCVRSADFQVSRTNPGNGHHTRFTEFTRTASVFPYVVAPACWTLPSHVSLITGLYPWEHRVHGKGNLKLPQDKATITEELRQAGYRTQLLSGNPVLDSSTGFERGFDETRVAEWWEPLLRIADAEGDDGVSQRSLHRVESAFRSWLGRMLQQRAAYELMLLCPFMVDAANRAAYRFCSSSSEVGVMSPWIERSFRSFLRGTPPDQPIFSFINLFDAHEPYLTNPATNVPLLEWWRSMSVSQDPSLVLTGRHRPGSQGVRRLHELYLASLETLVHRVDTLIRELDETDRWKNTLFVLTSDHGQSFLEDGGLFHGSDLSESVTRVPLLIRFPSERPVETNPEQWVSLTDIARLVREYVGLPSTARRICSTEAYSFHEADAPVYAFAEGLVRPSFSRLWLPPHDFNRLNRIQLAAYLGEFKACVDSASHESRTFRILGSPNGRNSAEDHLGPGPSRLSVLAQQKLEDIAARLRSASELSKEVGPRLASWGYV